MKLIDKDALIDKYQREIGVDLYRYNVIQDLVDAPTVDAVPVIRCKDCKYYSGFDCHMWNHRGENTRLLVYEDDYCSNAVRKEE